MWFSTSMENLRPSGVVMSPSIQQALRIASFMPTRPMVEKWLLKVPRYLLVYG